jgi:hypothetical protein
MAVNIDDLLVEEVAFEQKERIVFGQKGGTGSLAELEGA